MTRLSAAPATWAPPCVADPDRWVEAVGDDPLARALCRGCPRRWACAEDALRISPASGIWAGVCIPESGRGRSHALRQLKSLVEHGKSLHTSSVSRSVSAPSCASGPKASHEPAAVASSGAVIAEAEVAARRVPGTGCAVAA